MLRIFFCTEESAFSAAVAHRYPLPRCIKSFPHYPTFIPHLSHIYPAKLCGIALWLCETSKLFHG